jgi:hypothetical protein
MLVDSSYTKIDDWNFPGFPQGCEGDLQTTAVGRDYFAMQAAPGRTAEEPAITIDLGLLHLARTNHQRLAVAVNQFF